MKIWNQAPFVRLLFPFLVGILLAVYFPFQSLFVSFFSISLVVSISLIVLIPKLNISFRKSSWFGILVNSTLFLLAYQLTISKTESFSNTHFSKLTDSSSFVLAKLTEPYLEKEKSLKVVMKILSVKQGDRWIDSNGKAMVYLKKDSLSMKLKYGDEVILKALFIDVPAPQNPGEFNYKRFLAFHNVFQQTYVDENNWFNTGINTGNFIMRFSINLRNKLLDVFKANDLQGDEYAVGSALLLGYVDKLDADIISAYSSTGALHVLSVSGLHVAIVYIVFNWLLFFLDKIKHGNIIKAIILLLLLWFYALLTGSSPSVLRSAAMFSFVIISKAFNRNTNIYNTLAASAFFLFLFNPYLIMDVGFQLSYLAVIGIVYIQPKIHNWFNPSGWLLEQLWTITSVSIAAQIATFPIGLHYFHQFPNYFLLSNFIVIPVSTVIIYLGLSVFAFAKISFVVKYLSICFGWSVWLLNSSVKLIEKWPYSLLQGISVSVFETCVLYVLIVVFFLYSFNPKLRYLVLALLFVIIILLSQIFEQQNQYHQKKLIVYNIPKTSAIDFISSRSNVLLTDTVYALNENGLLFHIKHNWWDLGLNESKVVSSNICIANLKIENNFVQFYDKRLVIISKLPVCKITNTAFLKPLIVDYLILSNNTNVHLSELVKMYHASKIVFDSSNSAYKTKRWKKECIEMKQPYYSVADSGALVVDL